MSAAWSRTRTPKNRRKRWADRKKSENAVITDPELLNKKFRRDRLFSILSVLSLLLAALILVSVFTVSLWKLGILSLPAPIERLLHKDSQAPPPEEFDDRELRDLIVVPPEEYISALRLDESEYLSALADTPGYTTCTYTFLIVATDGPNTASKRCRVWRDGDRYRAETYDTTSGEMTSLLVCDGIKTRLTVFRPEEEPQSRVMQNGSFTLENQIGIPSVTDFIGREDIEDLDIRIVRSATDNQYRVSYRYIGIPQTEVLYLSLERRLILSAETFDENGQSLYRLTVTGLADSLVGYTAEEPMLFYVE